MPLFFEWDPVKARRNKEKHDVTFDEASAAFEDPLSLTIPDPLHSEDEARFVLIGMSRKESISRNRSLVMSPAVRITSGSYSGPRRIAIAF